jgi:hypothetical protein
MAALASLIGPASAGDAPTPYPTMAPIDQFRMASREEEIALARSAAPPSISAAAEVLVLGAHNYETAAKGTNGFVCFVGRSWTAGLNDPVFGDPKLRSPICLNPAAARSVLPHFLERTAWVFSGVPRAEMIERTKAAIAAGKYVLPEAGAMSFMMSKQGFMDDKGGHWHPHLMFFTANLRGSDWGANLPHSPVLADTMAPEPITIFFIPIAKWSDGTPDDMPPMN